MFSDFFQDKDSSSCKIKYFANIDGCCSPFDNYINFFDLSSFYLSWSYPRSESIYLNYISLVRILEQNNIRNCLILCSDFNGALDLDFLKKKKQIKAKFSFYYNEKKE